MITIDKQLVSGKIQRRERSAHKGNFGRVLIFAGSVGMAGAAVLCARSCLKGGAGLVRFLLPSLDSPLYPILQIAVPEATCVAFAQQMDLSEYSAIAVGPGLGSSSDAIHIFADILSRYKGTLVLDADALNLIASQENLAHLVDKCAAYIVMTPHVGEARRLNKTEMEYDWNTDSGREEVMRTIARRYNSVVLLKGAGTLVGTADITYINTTGNPGMATGGSGDVLTGLIASLAGQGYNALEAAVIGAWIHGRAGDMAAEELGEMGMISSDIAAYLPYALKEVYPPA